MDFRFPLTWCIILTFSLLFGQKIVFSQSFTESSHDFSLQSNWNSSHENCSICHVQKRENDLIDFNPVWNNKTNDRFYYPYKSSTLNAYVGQPDGVSKMCLSCHDGTIARDNFINRTTVSSTSGRRLTDGNLDDDHPISFVYDTGLSVKDRGLADPMLTDSGLGGTIYSDLLINGKLECSSCHDVHNTSGAPYLLKKTNYGSRLCLTCHNK